MEYSIPNLIGQFVTILSVNKTRNRMGAMRSFFIGMGAAAPIFFFGAMFMKRRSHYLARAAIIAALYAVLTHMQNILIPNSATMAIQFRASEALCVLALFTPAAIPGLTLGCLIFNLISGATALDFAFIVSPALAVTVKSARIHQWNEENHPVFKDEDYAYPLQTILSDGDVVNFEADYYPRIPGQEADEQKTSKANATFNWFAHINTECAKNYLIRYFLDKYPNQS